MTAEIDRLLRFAEILPDFADWQGRMARDSETAAGELALRRTDYARGPRQWLETGAGAGRPGLIAAFVHGGYWRALRAEDHRFLLPVLTQLAGGVANLEYRLMPGTRMAGLVADVGAGLSHLARSGPGTRLLVLGHSAGAHLAARAVASTPELQAATVGLVLISGAFDLDLIARSFLQTELALTPDEIAIHSLGRLPPCPCLLVVGEAETAPFLNQARALTATSADARMTVAKGAHHMNILHRLLTGPAPLIPVLSRWLDGQPIAPILETSAP
jgi:arylformamidase